MTKMELVRIANREYRIPNQELVKEIANRLLSLSEEELIRELIVKAHWIVPGRTQKDIMIGTLLLKAYKNRNREDI